MKPLRLAVIITLFSIFFSLCLIFPIQSFAHLANPAKIENAVLTLTFQAPISSFTYSPSIPMPDETITFDASTSYDPDGFIKEYTWNFGDGNIVSLADPITTHLYPFDGNYTVELTVTDNNGLKGVASAVVQVSTVVFFRVCLYGTIGPIPSVEVTVYKKYGSTWIPAPVGWNGLEIKYDRMTQPDLANTHAEKYRNPGYTASILYDRNSSNIGFDIHPATWTVFFKFQMGSYVAYWPNETSRVFTYKKGVIETNYYAPCHQAHWDSTAGTYVIDVNNIPKDSVSPTSSHPIIVGVWCPPPPKKYYLTVRTDPTSITSIPGEGWYVKDTNVVLTAPSYVNISSTTRYRFSYWDVDGTSQGSGVNPITVCMNANHTATAHYILQYSVVFSHTGLSFDATGTVVTVDGAPKTFGDLPYTKWVDNGGSVSYSYTSIVSSSASGKQYRLNSVTGCGSPITVSGPTTVTGNYVIQYSVTFAQSGLDSSALGTVVTINGGTTKSYSQLPYTMWVDCGSSVSYSYTSPVPSSTSGKRFRLNSVSGPASPITVTGSTTVTGNYVTQYQVTFTHSGLDSSATGTVVTVNGDAKTYSQLPYAPWYDSGSSITYFYNSTVWSTVSGKKFRLTSVSGPTSPITVSGPTTVTGNYVIQYSVTFAQNGLDSSATGTVVTINGGTTKDYTQLPYTLWVDTGSSVSYSYTSPVSSSTSGKRFRLNSVTGPTSPITVTSPTTVTGNYVIQYSVTFAQTGLDSTATGTVVTINGGTTKDYTQLPYTMWVDTGGSVSYSYTSIVPSSVSGKKFRLASFSGPASPITVSGSTTVTGNYVIQYSVTFAQTGLDSSATGTVVTINGGITKDYSQLPYTMWVDSGSSVSYTYNDIALSTASGKRFKLINVSGPASPISVMTSVTVTGNYKIQYQVTFDQTSVGSDFAGTIVTIDTVGYTYSQLPTYPPNFWWDKDSSHSFSFASPLTVNATKQYLWSSTSGLSVLQSGTLAVTTSGSVTGNYVVANRVTFDQTGVGSDFTSTIVVVDNISYSTLPVHFYWTIGSTHSFSFQSPLVVAANSKQYVWVSTTGLSNLQSGSITITTYGSIIGNYKTQYYLTLATNPPGVASSTGAGWYDANTYAAISTATYVDIDPGSSHYRFNGWTTADMAEIINSSSPTTPVLMDKAKTVTANYVTQYKVTFGQTGINSDFAGTVVTVDTVGYARGVLPYDFWWDSGSSHSFSFSSPLVVAANSKQYVWISASGLSSLQSGSITVSSSGSVTGNYKTQYYLTVSSPYGTTGGQDWYDSSATAYASLDTGIVDHGNETRRVFVSWNGDASGTNYAQSNSITMNGPKTAVATWKTQYSVTFGQSGLDSSATDTVVTVNSVPKTYTDLPYPIWVDSGGTATYAYSNASSSTPGKQFILTSVTGPTSPITVTNPVTITGNYKIQYKVTFAQTGVNPDFAGTVVTVDTVGYARGVLPYDFWWDSGSSHSFSFSSPLVVNASKQYIWTSTSGLSTLQSGTLAITGSGSVTGNYAVQGKYQITFSQTGVGGDFGLGGTVVKIDGNNYNILSLPVSFWWDASSVHNFAYQSPLLVAANSKQYIWASTSGPWPGQSNTITVTASANVVGNYKTQYYLILATNPTGVASPTGAGWYNASTQATISTPAYVDIVPGSSRYRFNGWTTADMSEIDDPTRSPTSVLMDKAKTVTANYNVQYYLSVSSPYGLPTPTSMWFDTGTVITASVTSPSSGPAGVRYICTGWTGTGNVPASGTSSTVTFTITQPSNITWNWKTQYELDVSTAPAGLSPEPTRNPLGEPGSWWYDSSTSVVLTAQPITGYTFQYWDVDGTSQGNGVNPITVHMNGPHTATAHYQAVSPPPPPPAVGGYATPIDTVPSSVPLVDFAHVLTAMIIAAAIVIAAVLTKHRILGFQKKT